MDAVIQFELRMTDLLRAGRFYERSLGWQTTRGGR